MPTATHHIVLGFEVAKELCRFIAVSGLGTFQGASSVPPNARAIKLGRISPEPLEQIAVRAENGQRGYLSYPRIRIWVQAKNVVACKATVAQLYELLDHKRPRLQTIQAFFKADASDEDVRQAQNYVRFPIGFSVICHPKLGVAPTVVPAP